MQKIVILALFATCVLAAQTMNYQVYTGECTGTAPAAVSLPVGCTGATSGSTKTSVLVACGSPNNTYSTYLDSADCTGDSATMLTASNDGKCGLGYLTTNVGGFSSAVSINVALSCVTTGAASAIQASVAVVLGAIAVALRL